MRGLECDDIVILPERLLPGHKFKTRCEYGPIRAAYDGLKRR